MCPKNLLEIYGDRKGNLTTKTFYKTKKAVSQRVLSLKESEHLTSVTDGASLLDVAKLPQFFEYPQTDRSELYFREGETQDIWKDQSVGFEERITSAAVRLANNQSGDGQRLMSAVKNSVGHQEVKESA